MTEKEIRKKAFRAIYDRHFGYDLAGEKKRAWFAENWGRLLSEEIARIKAELKTKPEPPKE